MACVLVVVAWSVAPPHASASLTGPVEVRADGLEFPWDVLRMPDGRTLVTERPGRVRTIDSAGNLLPGPAYVAGAGVQKVLGIARSPGYASNRFVYLYVSYGPAGTGDNDNRVIRLTDTGSSLVSPVTVLEPGIRSDGNHDGGRIAFGPDGKLYVTTGDVHDPATPQNLGSFNGKILRIEENGQPAAGNPYAGAGARPYVWTYGHRHPQGIGWDACGRMWESEHGPSGESYAGQGGGAISNDEVNRIVAGANYGWPVIVGSQTSPGMRTPEATSGNGPVWAPGGLAFGPDGLMYVPMLAGTHLRLLTTSGDQVAQQTELYKGTYGRLRAATADATHLWFTTSNNSSDEKVLRVAFDPASIVQRPVGCPAGPGAATLAGLTRAQLRQTVRDILARQARALRSKRARRLARVSRLRLRDRVLPAGRLSITVDRPGIRRKRARVRILGGKAAHPRRAAGHGHDQAQHQEPPPAAQGRAPQGTAEAHAERRPTHGGRAPDHRPARHHDPAPLTPGAYRRAAMLVAVISDTHLPGGSAACRTTACAGWARPT